MVPVKAKIPTPIPLTEADGDRQKEYSGLSLAPSKAVEPVQIVAELDEDKKEFVRAVLGSVPFGKSYTIYGAIRVSLLTRTNATTEKMYDELRALTVNELKTDDAASWDLWKNRFKLLSTLSSVVDLKSNTPLYNPPKTVLEGPWHEAVTKYLLSMPAPLYQALLDVSDNFEQLVNMMVDQSVTPGFWPTVGRI